MLTVPLCFIGACYFTKNERIDVASPLLAIKSPGLLPHHSPGWFSLIPEKPLRFFSKKYEMLHRTWHHDFGIQKYPPTNPRTSVANDCYEFVGIPKNYKNVRKTLVEILKNPGVGGRSLSISTFKRLKFTPTFHQSCAFPKLYQEWTYTIKRSKFPQKTPAESKESKGPKRYIPRPRKEARKVDVLTYTAKVPP